MAAPHSRFICGTFQRLLVLVGLSSSEPASALLRAVGALLAAGFGPEDGGGAADDDAAPCSIAGALELFGGRPRFFFTSAQCKMMWLYFKAHQSAQLLALACVVTADTCVPTWRSRRDCLLHRCRVLRRHRSHGLFQRR